MSVQIFVRGKLLGIREFLAASPAGTDSADEVFFGRTGWISLLTEVLPSALLAEFGLARILLGTSGGDQFLVVLPSEIREPAEEFLGKAAADIAALSGNMLRLIWSITENLGDFSDIRKRLNEEQSRKQGAVALDGMAFFASAPESTPANDYFADLAAALRTATAAGWSPETPGRVLAGEGKHTWPIDGSADSILHARHVAPDRTERPVQGVLRGDVDNFLIRLRRAQNIEEHLQLSLTYKQFFAGELTIRCSMPEFWQKVTILYSGGDDFAILGDWDALLPLARELQRVFHRFAEENLKDLPGPEGKTITMAVALAPSPDASIASVYEEAGAALDLAKSTDKDCMFALGRILEWKQLSDAAELKDELTTLITRYGADPEYLSELCGLYRETAGTRATTRRSRSSERPWRFHRKLSRILPAVRDREGQKVRAEIIAGFVGRNPANVKLRPSGRVALEWARLSAGTRELKPAPVKQRPPRQRKPKKDRPPKAAAVQQAVPEAAVAEVIPVADIAAELNAAIGAAGVDSESPAVVAAPSEVVTEVPATADAQPEPEAPPAAPAGAEAPVHPDAPAVEAASGESSPSEKAE